MKNISRFFLPLFFLTLIVGVVSCAPEKLTIEDHGFFSGLWHGLVAFFSVIGKSLGLKIGVYALNNTGFTYWTGFVIGTFFCIAIMNALLVFLGPLPGIIILITVVYGVNYMK